MRRLNGFKRRFRNYRFWLWLPVLLVIVLLYSPLIAIFLIGKTLEIVSDGWWYLYDSLNEHLPFPKKTFKKALIWMNENE